MDEVVSVTGEVWPPHWPTVPMVLGPCELCHAWQLDYTVQAWQELGSAGIRDAMEDAARDHARECPPLFEWIRGNRPELEELL